MSNSIGSASLLIVPTFDGLSSKVDAALGSASGTASKSGGKLGQSTASGFGKGLTASGAVIGAFSSITNAAMSSISAHVGNAISRFDTLNNYPKVMQSLGYSAKDANSSISKMSDRLSSLPTKLDDMASTVQGIVAVTGDLDQATDAGLALNDMLIASGSSTQLTTAAMEQFRQMLSKGKPDMQDWKSLVSAMPGQMNQLAEAMLGTGATADDLYTALGGGGAEATITMDDLLNKMIELDQTGGDSITSFKEQAETAAGGINTSMDNASNAVTKGLTSVLDTIGKDNIATAFNDLKTGINDAFSTINDVVGKVMPTVERFYGLFKSNAGTIAAGVGTFAGLSVATDAVRSSFTRLVNTNDKTRSGFDTVKAGASGVKEAFALVNGGAGTLREGLSLVGDSAKTMGSGLKGVFSGLVSSIDPVSLAITGVTAAISLGVAAYEDWKTKTENLTKATSGLDDVVSRTDGLTGYSAKVDGIGASSDFSAKSVDELADSIAKSVDTMEENTAAAEGTIATLNTAQSIVDQSVGKTDLSTEAQGRLKWALQQLNDQLGLNITEQDVLNGTYEDADGNVQDLKQSIDELVSSKKEQARIDAITANLTEAYSDQSEAAKTLAQAQNDYNAAVQHQLDTHPDWTQAQAEDMASRMEAGKTLESAKAQYDSCTGAVEEYSKQLGDAAAATEQTDDALQQWVNGSGTLFEAQLASHGQSLTALSEDLHALGASAEDMGKLSSEQLEQLARDYDGTTASIVGDLEGWGVGMDEAKAAAAELAGDISETLSGMEGLGEKLSGMGVDVDSFAQALADAGVSTETLNSIGSENLSALASACDGDVSQMVATIGLYNATPILDKDGNVNVDDVRLVDAQGNLYTWNGSELLDKDGNAAISDTSVTDAQGHKLTWNGTNLEFKTADGTVRNLMDSGIQARDEWNRTGLNNYTATGTVNIFKNITETVSRIFGSKNAAGGIRLHADGGIVPRYHADGAIATRAVPLDIVGEAGAEAIVPLTNRRYSEPFARQIAEQVAAIRGGDTYNVNLSATDDARLMEAIDLIVSRVRRSAAMA